MIKPRYGAVRSAEDEEALMREWASFAGTEDEKMALEWEPDITPVRTLDQDDIDSLFDPLEERDKGMVSEPGKRESIEELYEKATTREKPLKEPRMEDILASIRRIMAETADNPEPLNAKPVFRLNDPPKKDTPYVTNWENVTALLNGDDYEPPDTRPEPKPCPKCGNTSRVLCPCEIDHLLGFDDDGNHIPIDGVGDLLNSKKIEKSFRDRLIDMRTNRNLRSESMPFWSFLSNLAMGMTAIRDSWPKNWKRTGLWMNEDNRLILNGEEWIPTQDDILADDWQIGD